MLHATITEPAIIELVDSFYAKVRRDPSLGPLFEGAIGDHWDTHLPKMYAFWSSVLLTSGRYKGNPVQTHLDLPSFPPAFFERWLGLFEETARERFLSELAETIVDRAQRIAESLKLALYYRPREPETVPSPSV